MYSSQPLFAEVFACLMSLKLIKILGHFDSECSTVTLIDVVCGLLNCSEYSLINSWLTQHVQLRDTVAAEIMQILA